MGSGSAKEAPQKRAPRGRPFQKGDKPAGGRKPGVPNKVTQEFRETVRQLLDDNRENVAVWLAQVASGETTGRPDPGKALDLLARLAEFAAPKLGRVEHVGNGENGEIRQRVTVEFVARSDS